MQIYLPVSVCDCELYSLEYARSNLALGLRQLGAGGSPRRRPPDARVYGLGGAARRGCAAAALWGDQDASLSLDKSEILSTVPFRLFHHVKPLGAPLAVPLDARVPKREEDALAASLTQNV